jgi:hypothetical protein
LHHDKAPSHTAFSIQQFLAKNKMVVVSNHPNPLLTHLTPCDYFLYPRMKQDLKGRHFADVAEVQWESLAALDNIPIDSLRHCFQEWEQRWDHCIHSQGEYFERD